MTDVTTVRDRPRRWPLYTSLFLNVVLIAVVAFGVFKVMDFKRDWKERPLGPWMPKQVERVLPEESRVKVRAIREAKRDEFRRLFEEARTAREGVRIAVETEPFDAAKLRAALAAMRQADSAIAEASGEVMVEIASVLTPEERRAVREKMRDHKKDRKDRDADDLGPDGPPPPPPPSR